MKPCFLVRMLPMQARLEGAWGVFCELNSEKISPAAPHSTFVYKLFKNTHNVSKLENFACGAFPETFISKLKNTVMSLYNSTYLPTAPSVTLLLFAIVSNPSKMLDASQKSDSNLRRKTKCQLFRIEKCC